MQADMWKIWETLKRFKDERGSFWFHNVMHFTSTPFASLDRHWQTRSWTRVRHKVIQKYYLIKKKSLPRQQISTLALPRHKSTLKRRTLCKQCVLRIYNVVQKLRQSSFSRYVLVDRIFVWKWRLRNELRLRKHDSLF